ncbi:hypothetical protein B0H14DRAFT_1035458 [Mycena olivaceomarginata]|nr:hypothetical protein B0H14DRAFT_1035458 [Mycena olivaceomarginata]
MRVSGERTVDLVRFLHDLLNVQGLQLHFYAHNIMLLFVPHELSPLFSAFPSVTSLTFPIIHRGMLWWRLRGTSPSWIHSPAFALEASSPSVYTDFVPIHFLNPQTCSKGSQDCDDFASLIRSNWLHALPLLRSFKNLSELSITDQVDPGVTPKDRSYT